MMKSVELFAGAGGLGMGVSLAGFNAQAVIEWDRWAADTIRENKERCFPLVEDWPLHEGDVRAFDYSSLPEGIDLVSGGPPCQPFSIGGKHRGHRDDRDLFSATVDVVRELKPRAFIVENVRGLTRPSFSNYFAYILLQFEFPEIQRRNGEEWMDHLSRLEREKTTGRRRGLTYEVIHRVLNAANYGVPQKRDRVFIVGFREDLGVEWSFPDETHTFDALLADQWVTGEYWDRHEISKRRRLSLPRNLAGRVDRLRQQNPSPTMTHRPWRTVRDALSGMPKPRDDAASGAFLNHRYQPGARVYKGHTGSPLDLPAKTLKAGDHNVEHTMMVTLVGQQIICGRLLAEALTPEDWLHYTIALLVHDIGYVRGACKGDGANGVVVDESGRRVTPPRGASDAFLAPYHIERGKIYARERL